MHALSKEFDVTELRRARASLETIDLRALEFGPDELRKRLLRVSEWLIFISLSCNNSWYARAYPRVKNWLALHCRRDPGNKDETIDFPRRRCESKHHPGSCHWQPSREEAKIKLFENREDSFTVAHLHAKMVKGGSQGDDIGYEVFWKCTFV